MTPIDLTSADIRYEYGGKFTSQDTWIHPTFILNTWEILFMIRGTAYLFEGDTEITAETGDCILLRPGIEHGGTRESTETVSFFWLHCSLPEGSTILDGLPRRLRQTESSQIPLFCRQILHVSQLHMYPETMSDLLIRLLLTEYAVQAASDSDSPETRLINDIREWIRINTKTRPLTAAAVAAHFRYNEDYLSRLFRKKIGIGIKACIDRSRMDHIRSALLTTDLPLKTIAYDMGFTDYKAFLKYFTYHEALTPTAMRERFYRTHTNNH